MKTPENTMILSSLMAYLLAHIQAFSLGMPLAELLPGAAAAAAAVPSRGIQVLFSLIPDPDGDPNRAGLHVYVLFRGDAMGPSAGEILASIQKGLLENPFAPPGYLKCEVKHLITSHTILAVKCVDELTLTVTQSLDLHTSTFALTLLPAEEKAA